MISDQDAFTASDRWRVYFFTKKRFAGFLIDDTLDMLCYIFQTKSTDRSVLFSWAHSIRRRWQGTAKVGQQSNAPRLPISDHRLLNVPNDSLPR